MGKTDVAIPKRKSLAGKCGIPFKKDREYGEPVFSRRENDIPTELVFPNEIILRMEPYMHRDEFGREIFGNLCRHWVMRLADRPDRFVDMWQERGRWFVRKDFRPKEW